MMNQTSLNDPLPECSLPEELESLAAERQESLGDVFISNGFCGNATLAKKDVGLTVEIPLPGVVPHGISLIGTCWGFEVTRPLRWIHAPSEEQKSRFVH